MLSLSVQALPAGGRQRSFAKKDLRLWSLSVAAILITLILNIPVSGESYHFIADVQITPGTSGEILYPLFKGGPDNMVVE